MAGLTKEQKAEKAIRAKAVDLSGVTAGEFDKLSTDEQSVWIDQAKLAIDPDTQFEDDAVDDSHLVEVQQGAQRLKVHASTLDAHKQLGWRVVE